jgi:uncharacterized protein (DUF952 family)
MEILHICPQSAWEAAQVVGEYRADSLKTEGFIHCSTYEQVVGSANRFYRGKQGLVLLVIAPELVASEVRYEVAGDGLAYPHIYGPLSVSAVTATVAFPPEADGTFKLPSLPF